LFAAPAVPAKLGVGLDMEDEHLEILDPHLACCKEAPVGRDLGDGRLACDACQAIALPYKGNNPVLEGIRIEKLRGDRKKSRGFAIIGN
jgi:hypothetical protein